MLNISGSYQWQESCRHWNSAAIHIHVAVHTCPKRRFWPPKRGLVCEDGPIRITRHHETALASTFPLPARSSAHGRARLPSGRPMGPRPARAAFLHPRHSHANNVCFRLHPGRHMDGTFSAQARLAPPLVATLLVWPVHAAPRRATRMVYVSAAAHSRASRAGSQHGCHRRAALTHSDRAHSGRLLPTLPRLLDARVRLG